MSFSHSLSARQLARSLALVCSLAVCTAAGANEQPKEAPAESFTQAGKAYFIRAADKLVDSVSGRSENLINQAMELIGVRYRWNMDIPQ
jgi:cell wall-associated NlpC family hydrolase